MKTIKTATILLPVYLKTIHNQLSAIFNHAVRYYNLRENPCKKAGSMGMVLLAVSREKFVSPCFWASSTARQEAGVVVSKPTDRKHTCSSG